MLLLLATRQIIIHFSIQFLKHMFLLRLIHLHSVPLTMKTVEEIILQGPKPAFMK
jgi:hypothetical protein